MEGGAKKQERHEREIVFEPIKDIKKSKVTFAQFILLSIGRLSNNGGESYKNVTEKVCSSCFKLRANGRDNSQQRWDLLANNVAPVCTVLKV